MVESIITPSGEAALETRRLSVSYNGTPAVRQVSIRIPTRRVVAFIGPSGCGKSTLLRCLNRMNDLVPAARIEGEVLFHDVNLYGPDVDPVEVRRRIGMVFQKPNPFPKSIYDNVAYGPRINGIRNKARLDEIVELGPAAAEAGDLGAEGDVVVDRLRERVRLLEDHADAPPDLDRIDAEVVQVHAVVEDLPLDAGRVHQVVHPVEAAQQRALAAAGGADERGDLVATDRHARPAHRLVGPVVDAHVGEVEDDRPEGRPPPVLGGGVRCRGHPDGEVGRAVKREGWS